MTAGAPLHPQARAFLDEFAASGIPMPWEVASASEARDVLAGLQVMPDHPTPVGSIQERTVQTSRGDMLIRIYAPEGDGPFPVVLWFHGGGWVVGSIDESDAVCRSLCRRAGVIVLCPNYRLAPEHRFPAAAEDCYAITEWAVGNSETFAGRAGAVAVAGDSAGGNLAAAVTLMARDRDGPSIVFQLLVYPVVGLPSDGRRSYDLFGEGHFLTRVGMDWFTDAYMSALEDAQNPYLVPLLCDDLSCLPPALVITAGFDPLRDEGAAYAQRLREAGIRCTHTLYQDQIHAFFVLPDVFDAALEAHAEAADALRRAFAPPTRD